MIADTLDSTYDVIVVGAGLCGLIAAQRLTAAGLRIVILDKGRGVGGRLATRRMDPARFDHGAQFFTARDPDFAYQVEQWQKSGVVLPWSTGFRLSSGGFKDDGVTRFRGANGMAGIAKNLAKELDVRLSHKVAAVENFSAGWKVKLENGDVFLGRSLILTPPVPQSLELLDSGKIALPDLVRLALAGIRYAPCLALLVRLAGSSIIPAPGGLWFRDQVIAWIADNSQKGISEEPGSLTIHASPEYSIANLVRPDSEVTAELLAAAGPWLGGEPIQTQLHRWRYSQPTATYSERCLPMEKPFPLVFAGDGFGGPRVEGAALSGLAASSTILDLLK